MKKLALISLCMVLSILFLTGCSKGETYAPRQYTADGTQISEINIDVRDRQIEISPSEDDQIYVDYFESDKESYQIDVSEGQVLTITSVQNKKWTDFIGGKAPIDCRIISLKLPNDLLTKLSVSTTNEDISVSELKAIDEISLSVNSGNIIFEELDAHIAIALSAKNGDISGTMASSLDNYAISCDLKKSESNLPAEETHGSKALMVSNNNGNVNIQFADQ